jgi:drug/metabolite transporter (DMT)-like permease
MDPLLVIALAALGVLVVGWLFVSFSPPGHRRELVEWSSAIALYAALLCLFISLVRRALSEDSTVALIAFGFLCAFFSGGLVLSLVKTVGHWRRRPRTDTSSTTH